jgi:hypothetical protein
VLRAVLRAVLHAVLQQCPSSAQRVRHHHHHGVATSC